ncbi:MAG: DUF488 domain-containing protein [Candidatus Eisenbacteria bacterium]|uniref:DUF488 domain-containing protein n=1 Tax=Eiseniibacteriota bacterium TaxID=2212470 RepID=A0A933W9N6_UNCEI|nr:DUF488 domain-containing protein [Candidatus Eisenbacteria bacterium]
MNHVYTIGHSLHTFERFRELLAAHAVEVLVDVRSRPVSARAPHFSGEALRLACVGSGLKYLPMGDSLGGRASDHRLIVDGRVSYERVAETALFRQGLERVREGAERFVIALMCAEKDPLSCHRTLLVSRHLQPLLDPPAEVRHILADGSLKSHADLERDLLRLWREPDGPGLFEDANAPLARAYASQGREVAWLVREGPADAAEGERP